MPHKAYTGISLPRWNLKSLTLASYPQQSALYAILPAKVNWRSSASDKSLPRSRKTPFDLGCSRDTSRGCVGRRCTVLSYTFRSHPYQNTVERGCCSKVFFGLRNNDAGPSCEQAIHPEGNAIFGYDGGNHFVRNGRVRPKGVFCCERPIRANPPFTGRNSV